MTTTVTRTTPTLRAIAEQADLAHTRTRACASLARDRLLGADVRMAFRIARDHATSAGSELVRRILDAAAKDVGGAARELLAMAEVLAHEFALVEDGLVDLVALGSLVEILSAFAARARVLAFPAECHLSSAIDAAMTRIAIRRAERERDLAEVVEASVTRGG